jgi:tetratricopeptide (TPR) repeat protein
VGLENLGEYSAALHLYYQALEFFQHKADLRTWEVLCRSNIASCLLRLNRAPEALLQAEQAASIYRTSEEIPDFAWTLIYLAWAQIACNQVPAALRTLEEAHQLFQAIGAAATTGLVHLIRSEALLLLHHTTQARAAVEQAQAMFRQHEMKRWEIEADLLSGRIHEAQGDLARATTLAEQAGKAARQAELPRLEFGSEVVLGRLAQQRDEEAQAEQHYLIALNLLEGLMTWLVRDQRSTFLTDKEPIFNALISLALRRRDTNTALDFLERLRSQVLREYLTRSSEIRLKVGDPEEALLLTRLQQLRQELQGYTGQMAAIEKYAQEASQLAQDFASRGTASTSDAPSSSHQALLQKLQFRQRQCEQEIIQLLERAFLQHESARFALLPKPGATHPGRAAPDYTLVERLSGLLPAAGVLVEYFFQDQDLLIFTLHAGQPRAEATTVPGVVPRLTQELLPLFRANIDMAGQLLLTHPGQPALHSMLETTIQGWSRQLYDILLQPIEEHLPHSSRLLLVPYGPLHLLPFHALFSEQGYLIERCEVSYLPAASMFLLQAAADETKQRKHPGTKTALVLGHSYGGKLKHIEREARGVARLLGTRAYLEDQATIARLQQASEGRAIIHLAAHGKNRAEAPDFSYLHLADAQLSVVDVFNLNLSAELVTLSGCETGLVVIGGGDELLGLARGFLYAGARSLLISLWNVEDESTAELMGAFYQGLLAGRSRAGALRNAQRTLIASARAGTYRPAWAHPYFWAPFRLLGDAGPIAF